MTNGIIIFVKNPEIGKAKTRIAATVGNDKALSIYKSLLSITKEVIEEIGGNKYLFYTHFINLEDEWSNDTFKKHIQVTGDLGAKMKDAFETALKLSDKVIIIGSDCPYISKEIIQKSFDALNKNDVVIGPTFDGGYYLLGMKTFIPELFDNMVYSTSKVFGDTVERIEKLSLTYHILPKLNDVDFYEDWVEYQNTL